MMPKPHKILYAPRNCPYTQIRHPDPVRFGLDRSPSDPLGSSKSIPGLEITMSHRCFLKTNLISDQGISRNGFPAIRVVIMNRPFDSNSETAPKGTPRHSLTLEIQNWRGDRVA